MEDRFYHGFVAGVIGGIVSIMVSHFSYFLGLTILRLSDWASILMFGREPPFSLGEQVFSIFIYIGWSGAVGSIFAYFLLLVSSRHLFLKAWVIGTTPYFVVYLLTALFQTSGTVPLPLSTVLSNYITTSIFSLVMGYSFTVLAPDIISYRSSQNLLPQPVAKHIEEDKMQRPNSDEK